MPRCRVTPTPEGRVRRRREHIHDSYRRSGRPAGRSTGGDPTTVSSCAQACEDTNHPDRSVATATVTVRLLVRARRRRDVRRVLSAVRRALVLGRRLAPRGARGDARRLPRALQQAPEHQHHRDLPRGVHDLRLRYVHAVANRRHRMLRRGRGRDLSRPAPAGRSAHRRVGRELHAVVPGPGLRAHAPQPLPGRARWRRVRVGPDRATTVPATGRRGRARLCADRCGRRDLGDRRVLRTRRMYAPAPRALDRCRRAVGCVADLVRGLRRSHGAAIVGVRRPHDRADDPRGVRRRDEHLRRTRVRDPAPRDPPRPCLRGAPRMAVAAGPRRIGERARLDRGPLGLVARAHLQPRRPRRHPVVPLSVRGRGLHRSRDDPAQAAEAPGRNPLADRRRRGSRWRSASRCW